MMMRKKERSEQEELEEYGISENESDNEEDESEASDDSNEEVDTGGDNDSSDQSTDSGGSDSNGEESAENEETGTITIVPVMMKLLRKQSLIHMEADRHCSNRRSRI